LHSLLIKWTKESAESIIRKYQEVVEQLNGQEAPPIEDIFKNIQDGFDNVREGIGVTYLFKICNNSISVRSFRCAQH
jgi:hypothetical protein